MSDGNPRVRYFYGGTIMRDIRRYQFIMKRTILPLMICLLVSMGAAAQDLSFDRWFSGETLRLDCIREGSAQGDTVWVEHFIDRQTKWYGSRTQLIDPFNNGDYRVVIRDMKSGRELYTRGYSNLFREYKDTPEGKTTKARYEETLLVPMPRFAVQIVLQKRDAEMKLYDATVYNFNPRNELEKHENTSNGVPFLINGDPSTKLDVAFVMQGFDDDTAYYNSVCRRMVNVLLGHDPFKKHRSDFNLYFVRGDAGVEYNTLGSDRYAMTTHVWQLHDVLGTTPCDHIVIVINNKTYGGGAIYNFYSVSSLHSMAEFVLTHELGHGIGGLADEYVDEDLSYADLHRTSYEPLEPNITNLVDFDSKWRKLVPKKTPVPTPDVDVPGNENGPVGAYEGAGYSAKGVYRPVMHCMMRDYAPFCPVCSQRLEDIFGLYTK